MNNLHTIDTSINIALENGSTLRVDYAVDHTNAIFDVCDLDGRICISGRLQKGDQNAIDLSSLRSGKYQLYIIDEGDIHREMINLN